MAILPALTILCVGVPGLSAAAASVTVTDLKELTVTVKAPATRLLVDDGRFLVALSLIHPDPVSVVAAWPRDINRVGDATYRRMVAKFPDLASRPQVASSAGTFSMEQALGVNPDVAVFSVGAGPSDEQVAQLERAGIAVVFIDFFNHPLENLEPSLLILGRITGREAEAKRFNQFRKARLDRIVNRVGKGGTRPRVFLEAHAGISADCCNSVGKGNVGDYITLVGGDGTYRLGRLEPGTYRITVTDKLRSNTVEPVVLSAGPNALNLSLQAELVVTGSIGAASSSAASASFAPGIGSSAASPSGRRTTSSIGTFHCGSCATLVSGTGGVEARIAASPSRASVGSTRSWLSVAFAATEDGTPILRRSRRSCQRL